MDRLIIIRPSSKTIIIIFILMIFISIIQYGQPQQQPKQKPQQQCNHQYKIRIDKLVNKILAFGEGGRKFPENDQQLKGFCSDTSEMIKMVEDYFKSCEPNDKQQMANIFIYSLKHVLRVFCRKRKTKKVLKFFEVAPCLNRYIEHDVCIIGFAKQSKPLILDHLKNDKLKYICCNYVRSMECVDNWIMSHDCVKNYRELLNDYVHGIFDNLINFMCGGENISGDNDKCERLPSILSLITMDDQQKVSKLIPYESFIFIMLKILEL